MANQSLRSIKQLFSPGTYCNSFVGYPYTSDESDYLVPPDQAPPAEEYEPHPHPLSHLPRLYVERWTDVFAGKNVLVIGYPYAQAGTQGHAQELMFGAGNHLHTDTQRIGRVSDISTRLLYLSAHTFILAFLFFASLVFSISNRFRTLRRDIVTSKKLLPFTKAKTVSIMRENQIPLRGYALTFQHQRFIPSALWNSTSIQLSFC